MDETLKTQLKILKLSDLKPSFSELARQYGLDRRTVKKYYDGYDGKPAHRNKPSKLDRHYELIRQKLSVRGVNVRAVYEWEAYWIANSNSWILSTRAASRLHSRSLCKSVSC